MTEYIFHGWILKLSFGLKLRTEAEFVKPSRHKMSFQR